MSLAWEGEFSMSGPGEPMGHTFDESGTRPAGKGAVQHAMEQEASRLFHERVVDATRGSQWRQVVTWAAIGFAFPWVAAFGIGLVMHFTK